MAQDNNLDVQGLYTHPNKLKLPSGALTKADNIVIDRENIFQSRRGYEKLPISGIDDIPGDKLNTLFLYQNQIVAHSDDVYGDFPGLVSFYDESTDKWSQIGDGLNAPTDRRPRFTEAGGSAFFTTQNGIYKIDTLGTNPQAPYLAGGIKALSGSAEALSTGTGWMPNGVAVAYRILWGYKDAQERIILGVPSQRIIAGNGTGSTRNVRVTFFIPKEVTTADFYQIYRSGQSASLSDAPDDNMGLVYEGNPTNSELVAGTITITDITPDTLIGSALYTNPNQSDNGIADANEPPPFAKDITVFRDSMIFANTVSFPRVFINLLTADGLLSPDADTPSQKLTMQSVALTPITFTASTSEGGTYPSYTYKVFTTGAPSENITNTAISIVNMINKVPDYPVRAYYVSGPNDLPGKIQVEGTILNDAEQELFFYVNRGGEFWNPPLPVVIQSVTGLGVYTPSWSRTGTTVTIQADGLSFEDFAPGDQIYVGEDFDPSLSPPANTPDPNFPYGWKTVLTNSGGQISYTEAGVATSSTSRPTVRTRELDSVKTKPDIYKNGIYFSKVQEYEAVPLGQVLFAGNDSEEILRIVPLRDSVIVLKTDGIYRLTGSDPYSFSVYALDTSVRLLAVESAQVLANQVVAYTNQGVVSITDSGVTVVSRPIENTLNKLLADCTPTTINKTSFAISYEIDRKYILFVPSSSTDTQSTQAYVYNLFTNSWTRWSMSKSCGIVSRLIDKLLLGANGFNDGTPSTVFSPFVSLERKSFNYTDYADESYSVELIGDVGTMGDVFEFTNLNFFNLASEGDVVYIDTGSWGIIKLKDFTNNTITLDRVIELTTTTATLYKGIQCSVSWAPVYAGQPGLLKQFDFFQFWAERATPTLLSVNFATELSPTPETVQVIGTNIMPAWGLFPWGSAPWDLNPTIQNFRVGIPKTKQRAAFLYIGMQYYSTWSYFDYEGSAIETTVIQNSRTTK